MTATALAPSLHGPTMPIAIAIGRGIVKNIRHAQFGLGRIMYADDKVARINFNGQTKDISLEIAKLEAVDDDLAPVPASATPKPQPVPKIPPATVKTPPLDEVQSRIWQGMSKKNPPAKADNPAVDPIAALARFEVTEDVVARMSETILIWRKIIASAHVAAWIAPGNGGKTTIAKKAAAELSASGWQVFFLQEDAGAGDLPALFAHAKEHGYKLLNSTLGNATPADQIEVLRALAVGGADLSRFVFFFDTLKKYAELMSKGATRELFTLLRSLTARGATIILLGHANKHRGIDGKLIFEGVGDIRNDVDELIYLESTERDTTGKVVLTMTPDKVRSLVKPVSFELDTRTMELRLIDQPVDIHRARQQREDVEAIAVVQEAIATIGMKKTALADLVAKRCGVGRRVATTMIERYSGSEPGPGVLWLQTHMRTNNTIHISLPPVAV